MVDESDKQVEAPWMKEGYIRNLRVATYYLEQQLERDENMIPHKCPVCNGQGFVTSEYEGTSRCPACTGRCIVWEEGDDKDQFVIKEEADTTKRTEVPKAYTTLVQEAIDSHVLDLDEIGKVYVAHNVACDSLLDDSPCNCDIPTLVRCVKNGGESWRVLLGGSIAPAIAIAVERPINIVTDDDIVNARLRLARQKGYLDEDEEIGSVRAMHAYGCLKGNACNCAVIYVVRLERGTFNVRPDGVLEPITISEEEDTCQPTK